MTAQHQIIEHDEDGVIQSGPLALLTTNPSMVSTLARAEIDQQIATAHAYPRSIKRVAENILSLATLDEETAEECIYALPRGGKPIRGASIRLAEIIAGQWRNCRIAARVTEVNRQEKWLEAEGVFHDLETNVATRAIVRRRISNQRGQLLNDDMIIVTGNAACSIAKRNAILGGVPKAVWNKAYREAEAVIKGDVRTLSERRAQAIAAFGTWGVTPAQLFTALGVAGEEEVTLEHIPTLKGMYSAIKNGEATVEELFSTRPAAVANFTKVAAPLADEDQGPAPAAAPAAAPQAQPAAEQLAESLQAAAAQASPPMAKQLEQVAQQLAPEQPQARGHSAPQAQADHIEGPQGEQLKSRDGQAPNAPVDDFPGNEALAAAQARQAAEDRGERPMSRGRQSELQARELGRQAARQKRARKLPGELEGTTMIAEANAWLAGFDEVRAEQNAQRQASREQGGR